MTTITLNTKKNTIELTKTFATAAAKFGTEEYKQLQEVRRDYPTYRVITVSRTAPKPQFKGLTYNYMEKYIEAHDDEKQSIMNDYLDLRAMSDAAKDAMAEAASYQDVKDWFLNTYPAIKEFHEKRNKILAATAKAM